MSSTPLYWSLDGVIDELVAGLKALQQEEDAVLEGVDIYEAWPGDHQPGECIFVGDVDCNDMTNGMRGGAPVVMDEVYTIQLWVDVFKPGENAKVVMTRLTEVVGEVLAFVAKNPRINGTDKKSNSVRTSGWKYRPYVKPEGRGAACRIDIKVSGTRR